MSKVQDGQCPRSGIEFWYKDFSHDNLISLLIWVDKENLMEFLLFSVHYLYNYYMVYALLSHNYHVTHYITSYDMTLWLPVI